MNFKKFGLGNSGLFGVCDGLSNFTGVPVLLFRILALYLMFKGLFVFYWYAWILLFVGNISSGKKRKSTININLSSKKVTIDDKDVYSDTNEDSDVWEKFNAKFDKDWKKTSKKNKKNKKNKKKKTSDKKMSFDDFKNNHFKN
jgi:phage shock protein PspC (stress-responsive transcriptional regulator)